MFTGGGTTARSLLSRHRPRLKSDKTGSESSLQPDSPVGAGSNPTALQGQGQPTLEGVL